MTQRLEEIRGFAQTVTVLDRGQVRFDGSVPRLLALAAPRRFLLRLDPRSLAAHGGALEPVLRGRATLEGVGADDPEHFLLALGDGVALGEILGALAENDGHGAFLQRGALRARGGIPAAHAKERRVSAVPAPGDSREGGIFGELAKISAFLRRDFLQAWSYRMAFVTDAIGLALQTALFFYISKIVDPNVLPTFGGERVSYLEYVVVGIAMTMLIALGIFRAAAAFRNEQLMGTLEVLLMTPTAPWTIQIGSIVYDLVYIPLRTGLFIAVVALATDVSFDTDGIVPATVILLAFLPFVWGIGIVYAASSLTFKQAGGGIAITLLTFSSGAYFPLELFPDWLAAAAEANPMAVAIDSMREALLGGAGWSGVGDALLVLVPASLVMLSLGIGSFLLALRRERRRGTLGIY